MEQKMMSDAGRVVGDLSWDGLERPRIYYAMFAIFCGLFLSVISEERFWEGDRVECYRCGVGRRCRTYHCSLNSVGCIVALAVSGQYSCRCAHFFMAGHFLPKNPVKIAGDRPSVRADLWGGFGLPVFSFLWRSRYTRRFPVGRYIDDCRGFSFRFAHESEDTFGREGECLM